MNNKYINLFLILIISAICLSPRFSVGMLFPGRNIDIRAEDIIILFGIVASLFYVIKYKKYKLDAPILFWPIAGWIAFGLFSVVLNLLFGGLDFVMAFFYFLKELEFFALYFIVYYFIFHSNSEKQLIKYWLFMGLINVFWLVYVFIFNINWSIWYGPNAFFEPRGPFPSGGFFLILFIFLFNLFIFYYNKLEIKKNTKIIIFISSVLPAIGVISSGSRASILGLFISLIISAVLFLFEELNLATILKILSFTIFILVVFLVMLYLVPNSQRAVNLSHIKWEYNSGDSESRMGIFKSHLVNLLNHPRALVMGFGVRGEAHSQYMRTFLERGIVGILIFFWLMWSILKTSYRGFKEKNAMFKKGLCAGLFASTIVMLLMAIPNDVFMTVKPDEVYWFFTAMTMSVIAKYKII